MGIIGVLMEIFDYDNIEAQASHGQSAAFLPQWPYCRFLSTKSSSHVLLCHCHCYKACHADMNGFVK